MESRNKSTHILNTSANLMGICFVVFSSLKSIKISDHTYIDEFTALAMFLFMISCTLSFLSIRSQSKNSLKYEIIADYVFLSGLFIL